MERKIARLKRFFSPLANVGFFFNPVPDILHPALTAEKYGPPRGTEVSRNRIPAFR